MQQQSGPTFCIGSSRVGLPSIQVAVEWAYLLYRQQQSGPTFYIGSSRVGLPSLQVAVEWAYLLYRQQQSGAGLQSMVYQKKQRQSVVSSQIRLQSFSDWMKSLTICQAPLLTFKNDLGASKECTVRKFLYRKGFINILDYLIYCTLLLANNGFDFRTQKTLNQAKCV